MLGFISLEEEEETRAFFLAMGGHSKTVSGCKSGEQAFTSHCICRLLSLHLQPPDLGK